MEFESGPAAGKHTEIFDSTLLAAESFGRLEGNFAGESVELPRGVTVGRYDENFRAQLVSPEQLDSIHGLIAGRVAALHFQGVVSASNGELHESP